MGRLSRAKGRVQNHTASGRVRRSVRLLQRRPRRRPKHGHHGGRDRKEAGAGNIQPKRGALHALVGGQEKVRRRARCGRGPTAAPPAAPATGGQLQVLRDADLRLRVTHDQDLSRKLQSTAGCRRRELCPASSLPSEPPPFPHPKHAAHHKDQPRSQHAAVQLLPPRHRAIHTRQDGAHNGCEARGAACAAHAGGVGTGRRGGRMPRDERGRAWPSYAPLNALTLQACATTLGSRSTHRTGRAGGPRRARWRQGAVAATGQPGHPDRCAQVCRRPWG
jgi:hypothetical protein